MRLCPTAPLPTPPLPTDAGTAPYATAPPFTLSELEIITAWSASMRRRGLSAELNFGHVFLTEALHVCAAGTNSPLWMVHKTSRDAVAVRLWPGLADIVPTVEDALAIVADGFAQASPQNAAA